MLFTSISDPKTHIKFIHITVVKQWHGPFYCISNILFFQPLIYKYIFIDLSAYLQISMHIKFESRFVDYVSHIYHLITHKLFLVTHLQFPKLYIFCDFNWTFSGYVTMHMCDHFQFSMSLSCISLCLPSPISKPSLSPTHFYSSSYFSSPSFTQSGLMASLTSRAFPCCNLLDLFGPIPLLL